MGREVRITVGEVEKFIDMLFYNTQRHCYVVVEIKTGKFDSSYAGQLGTYVVAINHQIKIWIKSRHSMHWNQQVNLWEYPAMNYLSWYQKNLREACLQLKRLRQNWKIKILAKETSKYIFNDAEENELNWQILVLNG